MSENFPADCLSGLGVRYVTLGCKLNFSETSSLRTALEAHGCRTLTEAEGVSEHLAAGAADICVLNTCSVTDVADQKGRQAVRRLRRENPDALLVVTGCYAQLQPRRLAEDCGADVVVGAEHKGALPALIAEAWLKKCEAQASGTAFTPYIYNAPARAIRSFAPSCSRGGRTRYFLKVQDGCDYFCTYCTIPAARGRSRNGSIASLVEQAKAVAAEGGKEIVITGVNTGDFGRTTHERFVDLLRALDEIEGIERFRISSIEPNLLTDDIIAFCAGSRAFMPHFHVPLQSGSDEVLGLMRRHYGTQLFRERCQQIVEAMPDAFIGVDIIAGMRGETPERFAESLAFVKTLPIAQLHVFPYSERPGTRALEIPYAVSAQEKHARTQRLIAVSERKHADFCRRFAGAVRPVLWEHARHGEPLAGWTDNYIRLTAADALMPPTAGCISPARVPTASAETSKPAAGD